MKLSAKYLLAAFSMLTVMAVTPTSAFAGGSVHLNGPGFSIGIHDNHKYRKRNQKRYRNRSYNDRRYYNNNYYSGNRRYYRNSNRYSNQSYDRQYDRNSYDRRYDRRVERCPIDGYSSGYDRNRDCYDHKGHYHCS